MKRTLKIVAIIVAALIVIVLIVPFFVNVDTFKPQIESQLGAALGREVKLGDLRLSILGGSVSADNLSISEDPAYGKQPFLRARALNIGVKVWPLVFAKELDVTELTIDQPQVALWRNAASGKWNFSSLGNKPGEHAGPSQKPNQPEKAPAGSAAGAEPLAQAAGNTGSPQNLDPPAAGPDPPSSTSSSANPNLSVEKLMIKDGTLSMADISTHAKPQVYANVNITLENFSFGSRFPFVLTANLPGGGSAKLEGTAGPIDASDATLTPLQAKVGVSGLDLAASGFVPPDSGFGGMVNFDGTVTSNGREAQASGTASVAKLKASPKGSPASKPVNLKFSTPYQLQKQSGDLDANVTLGRALVKLAGTYQIEAASTILNMKLAAEKMPVDDLVTLLPALGVTLPAGSRLEGGTLTANFTINGPLDKLVINGPVQLVDTKLAGFDLGSKLSAIESLTHAKTGQDTTIQNFSTDAHASPQGIITQNINLNIPAIGVMTGNGTISPQNALNYQMNAKLAGAVGGLTQIAGLGNKSATIPFLIEGTTSDPKFVPNVKGLLNQFNPTAQGQNPANNILNGLGGLLGKKPKP
ncbi:MAG TPA: AsmA family protein [Terriglobales bacterium]|nr:AsmA family protein [Terriglobales bacterium]